MHKNTQITSIVRRMQLNTEILKACLKNDRRAQKMVYEYCYTNYIRMCMRYNPNHEDARFVLNNGFMKLLAGLEKVELESLNFYSWAKRIMANVIIDEYRKNKNHKEHLRMKENESELDYFAPTDANNAESDLGVESILKLLQEIPEVSAHVFTLYVMDGFSHKEIGDLLEITEGTSKWHLSTARKQLRDKLTALEAIPETKLAI